MNSFYTNCSVYGSNILLKEVDSDGVRQQYKINWQPTLYVTDNRGTANSKFKSLYGDSVKSINSGSIAETKAFVKEYSDVSGFEIFGQLNFALQFLGERYPWDIVPDPSKISTWSIDIETRIGERKYTYDHIVKTRGTTVIQPRSILDIDNCSNQTALEVFDEESEEWTTYKGSCYQKYIAGGFPDPATAAAEIVLITLQNVRTKQCYTFGTKPYTGSDTKYAHCRDEATLLKLFLQFWRQVNPDIITGWNIETFDIPYIANRLDIVLGEDTSRKLSPWGICRVEDITVRGISEVKCSIPGVAILDYLALYKKFTYTTRESYSLKFIAEEELGHTKVELPGKDFNDNIDNHWQIFTRYNIVDTVLVTELDEKLKLIDVAIALAYKAKINIDEVFSPVKLWDSLIVNTLLRDHIVVPQRKSSANRSIAGGYVKEPKVGFYGWNCTLDATSLYPSIMQSLNISPETVLGKIELGVDELLRRDPESEERVSTLAGFDNAAISAIGMMFDRSKEGFLGKIIADLMSERKSTKNKMLQTESEYELVKQEIERRSKS